MMIRGTVKAAEDLTIAGRVEGAIESNASVIVTEDGWIEGDIVARQIMVSGVVVGTLRASETLVVTATGQVQGEIRTGRLRLEPGGRVEATVTTDAEIDLPRSGARRARPVAQAPSRTTSDSTEADPQSTKTTKTKKPAAKKRAKKGSATKRKGTQKKASTARARKSAEKVEIDANELREKVEDPIEEQAHNQSA